MHITNNCNNHRKEKGGIKKKRKHETYIITIQIEIQQTISSMKTKTWCRKHRTKTPLTHTQSSVCYLHDFGRYEK